MREYAYAQLRQRILTGSLRAGQRVLEYELAEQLGVSRTPLREALRQLETDGLVRLNARRGAIITGFSADELREEFQIRAALEGLVIKLAATHMSEEQLVEMRDALRQMETALRRSDDPSFLEHHRRFHLTLYAAARAPRLYTMLVNLMEMGERVRMAELGHEELNEDELAQHRHLLERLERREGDAAAAEYTTEFLDHGELVIRRLAKQEEATTDGPANRG